MPLRRRWRVRQSYSLYATLESKSFENIPQLAAAGRHGLIFLSDLWTFQIRCNPVLCVGQGCGLVDCWVL